MGPWTLLGVPIYTLVAYRGMGDAPKALRKAGIGRMPAANADAGDVGFPRLKEDITDGKMKNFAHFRQASSLIYEKTKLKPAERVLVLGGECSETVGALAGFAEVFNGKAGMLWLDAHGDFNTPETSPSGYIGGMCLAMACGRTSGLGLEFGGRGPPLAEERLIHVGSRALDPPEVAAFNSSPGKLFTSQQVKKMGAAEVAEEAARHLANRSDWIACHLDVDVVDPEFIPSVNYPTPGGLTPDETRMIIRTLLKTEKMKVLELAAYNPEKDRGQASAKNIIELCRSLFA